MLQQKAGRLAEKKVHFLEVSLGLTLPNMNMPVLDHPLLKPSSFHGYVSFCKFVMLTVYYNFFLNSK